MSELIMRGSTLVLVALSVGVVTANAAPNAVAPTIGYAGWWSTPRLYDTADEYCSEAVSANLALHPAPAGCISSDTGGTIFRALPAAVSPVFNPPTSAEAGYCGATSFVPNAGCDYFWPDVMYFRQEAYCPKGYVISGTKANSTPSVGYWDSATNPSYWRVRGMGSVFDINVGIGISGVCVRNSALQMDRDKNQSLGGCGSGVQTTRFPINIGSGGKLLREHDLSTPTSLAFSRGYSALNSLGTFVAAGGLSDRAPQASGMGWRTAYASTLVVSTTATAASAFAVRGEGGAYFFVRTGSNWIAEQDVSDTLRQLVDGTGSTTGWRYIHIEGQKSEDYDPTGKLLTTTNRSGEMQKLSYSDGTGGILYATTPSAGGYTAPLCQGVPGTPAPTRTGLLMCVTDNWGRQLNFAYDADGRIAKMTDPAGQQYLYDYDDPSGRVGANNLTSVTYPDGTKKIYHYDEAAHINAGAVCRSDSASSANLLTGISDENGVRYATYEYDCQGRAVKEYHGAGTVDQYSLAYSTDASGNPTSTAVTDPLGSIRTYGFQTLLGAVKSTGVNQPGGSGCSAASNAQTYDANGNISSRTDFDGHKTCSSYDLGRNLETVRVEGLSSSTACPTDIASYSIPSNLPAATPQRKVTTTWHPDWRLEIKRAEPKKLTTWVYNGQPDPTNGNAIASCAPSTAFLPDGKPIAVLCKQVEQATTDSTGTLGFSATATGSARISTWTYNQYGQVLTANGPRTDVTDATTYTYYADTQFDGSGAGHTLGDLKTLTNAKGQVSTFTQYDRHGHPLEIQDANGNVTRLTYHPRGWLTAKSVGPASGVRETTQYDYDAVGQLKKVTNPDTSFITYTYDDAHRLTDVADGKGNTIHYTLDAMGNRTKEEAKDPLGVLARSQRSVYDALGRLQNLITPQQ